MQNMKQFLEEYSLTEKLLELKAKQECQSLIRVFNKMILKHKSDLVKKEEIK